jgi:hypothetical protein
MRQRDINGSSTRRIVACGLPMTTKSGMISAWLSSLGGGGRSGGFHQWLVPAVRSASRFSRLNYLAAIVA